MANESSENKTILIYLMYFLGSKVCYEDATPITKKVREALKSDEDGKQNENKTPTDSETSTTEQQNSNPKDADSESMKKRDKV